MTGVAAQHALNARRAQLTEQLLDGSLLAVRDHTREHGAKLRLLRDALRQLRVADQHRHRNVKHGGTAVQKRLRQLLRFLHADGMHRFARRRGDRRAAAEDLQLYLRHLSAQGSQLGQKIAAHRVDRRSGEAEPRFDRHLGFFAEVGRAAGLLQPFDKRLLRQLPQLRRLGNGSLGHTAPPLRVLHGKLCRLSGADQRIEGHAHTRKLAALIGLPRLREQIAVGFQILTDAEHLRTDPARVISLREALAGKHPFELPLVFFGDFSVGKRRSVDARDDRHVLGTLHPSLELDGSDAEACQIVQLRDEAVVAQGKRIALLSATEAVGQAAGLRALSAVAAAAADDGGKIALPRIAHTQRPMGKYFNFNRAVFADVGNVLAPKLTRQNDAAAAHFRRLQNAVEVVDAHLRAGVHLHGGRQSAAEPYGAGILHDEGVDTGLGGLPHQFLHLRSFPIGRQRVDRQMHAHAANVAVAHRLAQLVQCEIFRTRAGVERAAAKVDRVRTVLHGGAQRIHRPCRGQQFHHGSLLPVFKFKTRLKSHCIS